MWPAKDVLAALGADKKATSTGRDTHCARQRFMAMWRPLTVPEMKGQIYVCARIRECNTVVTITGPEGTKGQSCLAQVTLCLGRLDINVSTNMPTELSGHNNCLHFPSIHPIQIHIPEPQLKQHNFFRNATCSWTDMSRLHVCQSLCVECPVITWPHLHGQMLLFFAQNEHVHTHAAVLLCALWLSTSVRRSTTQACNTVFIE